MKAVLLAGGKGTRLYPYTVSIPKPLVPIGERPIIEIMLRQLCHYGIRDIILSIGHLGEIVHAFLGNGKKFGVNVEYFREETPLGTAGPLRAMKEQLTEDFLMMNGDVLTDLDYRAFLAAHAKSGAEVSIAAFDKRVPIDLGVLKTRDRFLYDYIEKPVEHYQVSMGIYAMRPSVIDLIPEQGSFDFPSLIQTMLKAGRKVHAWPFDGSWLDIGRPTDYERAQEVFEKGKARFLPA